VTARREAAPRDDLTDRQKRIIAGAESEHIRRLVASWPEPDEEQLRTLALLLRPGGDHDDA
jgi:hypothetical protein